MSYLSVTHLRLRSAHPVGLALFFFHTLRSAHQSERSPGFLGGRLLAGRGHAYLTLTLWQDEAAMRAYRKAGAHRAALRGMALLGRYCTEMATLGVQQEGTELPDVSLLIAELNASGRFVTLPRPSAAHRERRLEPILFPGSRALSLRRRPTEVSSTVG